MAAWDKQPDETNKSFATFAYWVRMPISKRNVREAAEAVGTNTAMAYRWSMKYKWMERAAAYDESLVEEFKVETQPLIIKAQIRVLEDSMSDYDRLLLLWRDRVDLIEQGEIVASGDELIKLAAARRTIDDMARRSVGLPGTIKQLETSQQEKPPERKQLSWGNTNVIVTDDNDNA